MPTGPWLPCDDTLPQTQDPAPETPTTPTVEQPSTTTPVTCTRCLALINPDDAQAHGTWHRMSTLDRPAYSAHVLATYGVRCQCCITIRQPDGTQVAVLCRDHQDAEALTEDVQA